MLIKLMAMAGTALFALRLDRAAFWCWGKALAMHHRALGMGAL